MWVHGIGFSLWKSRGPKQLSEPEGREPGQQLRARPEHAALRAEASEPAPGALPDHSSVTVSHVRDASLC